MKYKLIVFLFFSVLGYSQKVEIIKKFEVVNSIYDGTKLSKTEIIRNSLEKARVIHDEYWEEKIRKLLNPRSESNENNKN